jgi:predicted O-linked N-acetylglucosamine transferase (SPINDLY family)
LNQDQARSFLDNLPPLDSAQAWNDNGQALLALEQMQQAEAAFQSALALDPNHVDALTGLGTVKAKYDRATAQRLLLKALKISPDEPEALLQLGCLFQAAGHSAKSLSFFDRVASRPGDSRALVNKARALAHLSRFEEARREFENARKLQPSSSMLHSVMLLSLSYDPGMPRHELFHLHKEFGGFFAPASPAPLPKPGSKIRVGYVSGDFRTHACAWFLLPLLKAHDRARFDVTCYATQTRSDDITARFRALADHWRPVADLDDHALARLVVADNIDVLVDCSGHSRGGRLGLFAMKPALVSVSFLGYPNTTGLSAIDFRFTDPVADPPAEVNAFSTERLVRLPNGFLSYGRPREAIPDVAVPDARKMVVTFASFNNRFKINDAVIALWSKILRAVPRSRLLLKDSCFAFEGMVEDMRSRFAVHGIDADRLEFRRFVKPVAAHLGSYAEVDVALDPFPYNGTTTTCDALWMGVPVVTLFGDRQAGRMGASLLSRVGLADCIAETPADYVRIAAALAADTDRRDKLRRDLRGIAENSPLGRPSAVCSDIEAFYEAAVRGGPLPFTG